MATGPVRLHEQTRWAYSTVNIDQENKENVVNFPRLFGLYRGLATLSNISILHINRTRGGIAGPNMRVCENFPQMDGSVSLKYSMYKLHPVSNGFQPAIARFS